MRTTRTYAVLEVSKAAYDEIRSALERAGYDHAFIGDVVDMHGIAISAKPSEPPVAQRRP